MFRTTLKPSRVTFGLPNLAGDIDVLALGLDSSNRDEAGKQYVVSTLLTLGRPLGDRQIAVALGASALRVRQYVGVDLPARVAQQLIDQQACAGFIYRDLLGGT